jgi:DNA-binding ferritin-like protein
VAKKHAVAKIPAKKTAPRLSSQTDLSDNAIPEIADKHDDVATASILENFIDAAEKRNWFLFEASRRG